MARATRKRAGGKNVDHVGKRLSFDRETWNAVDLLARDQMKDIQEITEEAFRDLLKKYGRSADFREALKLSARRADAPGGSSERGKANRSKPRGGRR